MSRSSKKGPYIDPKLLKKVEKMNRESKKQAIKTWARDSQISPEMVGHTISVHTGKNFLPVFIVEQMVGHRLGEFAPTRSFKTHGRVVERTTSPT